MKEQDIEKWQAVVDACDAQRLKYADILNYIINKNSHPMPRGVDHDKLFDDIQDFEMYLYDN